ncbi:P protein isoform X1 [Pieris rapae]|uniref:P protein isoform X1 n=1 Tax=Pieris rapae TaxID=64459 RepID=UPI001E27E7F1|nr:P protein isoform X1 [Pieris rapae]
MEGETNKAFVFNENKGNGEVEVGTSETGFDSRRLQKFEGVYRSLEEKKTKCMKNDLQAFRNLNAEPELSRSQYSLVSTGELTAEALQVWLKLPKKIKYDPDLESFQKRYEKEIAQSDIPLEQNGARESKRLPLVKSAPHLNNNKEDGQVFDGTDEKPNDESLGHKSSKKQSKMAQAGYYIKMSFLLGCWTFFTLAFLMYNEKEHTTRQSALFPGETKTYSLNASSNELAVYLKLKGPFLTEQSEDKMNGTEFNMSNKFVVWLEQMSTGMVSKQWPIVLQDKDFDFSIGESRSSVLKISTNISADISLRMNSTANESAPFTITYTIDPIDAADGVIYACILLCGLYVLIIFEVINRTMAAVIIATAALGVISILGERPTLPELISWLDVETLLLLFSMMILVAIMAETGMFDFLAVYTFEVTKGKLWPLITVLCAITALLSTFLDNVTTVLLMTPVTIRLCEVMDMDPVPILMSMVLFSNIGGTATPVGDPPNVIIASNRAVVQAGINFTNFTMHMTLGILLVCVQTYFQLRFIYRDTSKLRLNVPREIQDLSHQISIWRRAIESLPHLSKDTHVVRERLERKMRKLNAQLEVMIKESTKRVCPKDTFHTTLTQLKDKYKIRDKPLLLKSTFAITFVVVVFFLHSIPELNRVSLGWTALLGAILLLTLADREDLEPILHRVEWSTLLFFAALFVLMEALSKLGLIEFIGGLTESLILKVDEGSRLAVALILLLWVSGVSSAFVDNIPLTTMMVRVVTALGSNPTLNLPIQPLIWALSFGACLGGNGTLIGASANVVCAGVAEQHGYKISFVQFFKIGFPVMIGHLIVATAYLLLCHCVFTWH